MVINRRVLEVHHVGVDGTSVAHGPEVLSETTEEVVCAWCVSADHVVPLVPAEGIR